jgi:hypothetical protein
MSYASHHATVTTVPLLTHSPEARSKNMACKLALFVSDGESQSINKDGILSSETSIHADDDVESVWYKNALKVSDKTSLRTTGLEIYFSITLIVLLK